MTRHKRIDSKKTTKVSESDTRSETPIDCLDLMKNFSLLLEEDLDPSIDLDALTRELLSDPNNNLVLGGNLCPDESHVLCTSKSVNVSDEACSSNSSKYIPSLQGNPGQQANSQTPTTLRASTDSQTPAFIDVDLYPENAIFVQTTTPIQNPTSTVAYGQTFTLSQVILLLVVFMYSLIGIKFETPSGDVGPMRGRQTRRREVSSQSSQTPRNRRTRQNSRTEPPWRTLMGSLREIERKKRSE